MFGPLKKWIQTRLLARDRQSASFPSSSLFRNSGTFRDRGWGSGEGLNPEKQFRQVTAETLENLSLVELSNLLVETDPTISRLYNDFVIFSTLQYEVTCEDRMGQAILDDFLERLTQKRNSFSSVLSKLFGSILLHGTYCFEITFDQWRAPTNLFVIDPDTLYFRTRKEKDGDEVWDLVQYDEDNKFTVLSPDRVFYDAVNPLLSHFKGHSMIAPAFPSVIGSTLMLKDLQEVVHNHAWLRKYIKINDIEMHAQGFNAEQITDRMNQIKALISSSQGFKDPSEVPVFTGPIEFNQVQGATSISGLQFVDTVDRVLERKSIRGGGGTPFNMGSNETVAETSSRSQGIRESIRTESFQNLIETEVGRALSMPLQGAGITAPAQLSLKHIDVLERDYEADIYEKMARGVNQLVSAGVPLDVAVQLYATPMGRTP